MKLRHVYICGLLLLVVPSGAATPDNYRFAPGDVIEVSVAPQSKFDRTVTVRPDGRITYPIVGELQAAGLTSQELAAKLSAGLNRDLVDPTVTVTLKELNRQAVPRVSLLGAVRNPSVYEIKEGTTVAEVLAAGGGPTPLADLRRVTITRADRTVVTVDLAQSGKTGRLVQNDVLQPGDVVVVPEGAPPTVLVLGEVARPGSYEIQGEARLLDALSLAGGPTAKADLRRVTLGRAPVAQAFQPASSGGTQLFQPASSGNTQAGKPAPLILNLQPFLQRGDTSDPELNVALRPGDTIVIPETDQQVYVLGRVSKPDVYALKPTDRVLDAIAKAGGAAGDGDISRAVLVRRGENGQPVAKPLDLKKMMEKGRMAENELLRPGDLLFVPDKKMRRSPGDVAGLLYPLTGLLALFR